MPVTEEELQEKRKKLARLREQTLEARVRRAGNEEQVSMELTAAQLDGEIAAHERELEREREAAKLTNIRAGTKSNLDAARDAMKAAEAALAAEAEASEPAADTTKEAETTSKPGEVKVKTGEEK